MTFMPSQQPTADRSRDQVQDLKGTVVRELCGALGARWVQTDPCILDTYIWQYLAEAVMGLHYLPRPIAVVLPANTREVAEVVKICNRLGVQYKAMSTGYGMWNSPTEEDRVVQIDLRRMDRIVKIDRDNMLAVVEPYVTGNMLQTEAMKVGLNTHIAGCGAQCSSLASVTSMMGQGWDGVSMGFSNRNLLGFEWVMPDGEIVQVGSFDAAGEDFAGDGPGFSIRGIVRGFAGALGGLGVFTRAAIKLYPWEGPAKVEQWGNAPNYYTEIPEHHTAAVLLVNDWKGLADLGYRIGEAEIATYLGRNAPALLAGSLTVDNNEAVELYQVPMLHELYYSLMVILTAKHAGERRWKRKVLRKILSDLDGGMLGNDRSLGGVWSLMGFMNAVRRRVGLMGILRSMPGFLGLLWKDARRFGFRKVKDGLPMTIYQSLLRSGSNQRGVFSYAGTFWTAMGALVTWDNAIRGAKVGAQVKKKYIREGVVVDDGGDNAWGGLYEGGAYSHLEELGMYDQTDPKCRERVLEYIIETNLACIENRCGDSLNAVGPPSHILYSPVCMDYDKYTQRIKLEFDPRDAACANMFTDPNFAPTERHAKAMEAVASSREPVRLED